MYAKKILNTIIRNNDSTAFLTIRDRDSFVFPEKEDQALYDFLYSSFQKHNHVPSMEFLEDFFALEKNNPAYKSYESLKDVDAGVTDNLEALIETQLNYTVKQRMLETQEDYETKLKMANTSEVKQITYNFQTDMSILSQVLESEAHKRGLLYGEEARDKFINKYQEREESDRGYYIGKMGFESIDNTIGGIHSVDLINIGGFTNQGKSPFLRQVCYNLLLQGLNCVFVSLEMDYDSIESSFYTLHANNYTVHGFSKPKITLKKIRENLLTDQDKDYLFNTVVPDFTMNDSYGNLYILQPEAEFCMDDLFMEVTRVHQTMFPVDVLVVDYAIPLIKPKKKGRSFSDDDYNSAHRSLRLFGLTFNQGKGLAILNAWQANRQGYEEAVSKKNKEHYYKLTAIGQYNAIEKDSTHVFSILQTPELQAEGLAQIQHLKSRESKLAPIIKVQFDGASGYLRETAQQDISDDELAGVIEELELD
jgi:replicative DNA helicase